MARLAVRLSALTRTDDQSPRLTSSGFQFDEDYLKRLITQVLRQVLHRIKNDNLPGGAGNVFFLAVRVGESAGEICQKNANPCRIPYVC